VTAGLDSPPARLKRLRHTRRALRPRWDAWTWGAIALTAAFVAISWWWVTQDRSVPSGDAGSHLYTAIKYRRLLADGDVSALWTHSGYYPPVTFLVGGLAALVGGVGVAAPVVGENLVYVPLLAVGCFCTGRLLGGARAGMLAVLFALGSPLVIEQFHVFMLDAPQAALVAVSVWLVLASRRFSRVGVAAVAGLAVGLGTASKEQFPIYVVGLLAVVLLRHRGWRNWRGILAFSAVAIVVAAPWYLASFSELGRFASSGGLGQVYVAPAAKPSLVSWANLTWYGWAVLNGVLFAPLCAFAAVGVGHTLVRLRRHDRAASDGWAPELLGGLVGGWLGITLTPHHDMRYAMPLIVYLAVLGTAWIASLRRPARLVAAIALGLVVVAATLGATAGVGGEIRIPPARQATADLQRRGVPPSDAIVLYSDHDFRVSAPRREDDVLAFMRALRREGVTGVSWEYGQSPFDDPVFDLQGVTLFARFAGLWAPEPTSPDLDAGRSDPHHAFLVRERSHGSEAPCMKLSDGTGIWVVQGDGRSFCPARRTWAS
jgi:4-amino-4-deoxy-L-arabinose transferase-like glycosyltransferase